MPVPATTGQLRTKVSDMQIGDYISCDMDFTHSWDTMFYNMGSASLAEIPVNGLSATTNPKGSFYFVKVAKGLLVADRVVLNTWSWDAMNSNKFIQGRPWDNGNIIPAMTSNTSPSGVASASSIFSSSNDAFHAFNRIAEIDGWQTAVVSDINGQWLAYEFPTPKVIRKYTIKMGTNNLGSKTPKQWVFEAFDGTNWIVLHNGYSSTQWVASEKRGFTFLNNTAYTKYRIRFIANFDTPNTLIRVDEVEMMDTVGIIRSLTGGVACADVNGNNAGAAFTSGCGAFPANNEWDKYIVNSDLGGKIKKGDDNVWHWSPLYTWTQDTFQSHGNNTRMIRGFSSMGIDFTNYGSSSDNSNSFGFRPVFEYKE